MKKNEKNKERKMNHYSLFTIHYSLFTIHYFWAFPLANARGRSPAHTPRFAARV
jgi:hypothetical protein